MLSADIVDRVGSAIRVEFQGITGSPFEITKEPDEGAVVNFAGAEAGFCKFADCKKDIGTGVVCKVEKCAYCRAERKLRVSFVNE